MFQHSSLVGQEVMWFSRQVLWGEHQALGSLDMWIWDNIPPYAV